MKIGVVLELKRALDNCPPLAGMVGYAVAKNHRMARGVEQDTSAALKGIQAKHGGVADEDGRIKYPSAEARRDANAEWDALLQEECGEQWLLIPAEELKKETEKREILPWVLSYLMELEKPEG